MNNIKMLEVSDNIFQHYSIIKTKYLLVTWPYSVIALSFCPKASINSISRAFNFSCASCFSYMNKNKIILNFYLAHTLKYIHQMFQYYTTMPQKVKKS